MEINQADFNRVFKGGASDIPRQVPSNIFDVSKASHDDIQYLLDANLELIAMIEHFDTDGKLKIKSYKERSAAIFDKCIAN